MKWLQDSAFAVEYGGRLLWISDSFAGALRAARQIAFATKRRVLVFNLDVDWALAVENDGGVVQYGGRYTGFN